MSSTIFRFRSLFAAISQAKCRMLVTLFPATGLLAAILTYCELYGFQLS
jgi:hypothetical protein